MEQINAVIVFLATILKAILKAVYPSKLFKQLGMVEIVGVVEIVFFGAKKVVLFLKIFSNKIFTFFQKLGMGIKKKRYEHHLTIYYLLMWLHAKTRTYYLGWKIVRNSVKDN